jgi:hypothetical protein
VLAPNPEFIIVADAVPRSIASAIVHQFAVTPAAGSLYITGADDDSHCTAERDCDWKRFAIIVRSTYYGLEKTSIRVLCTTGRMSQESLAPHCVQITISPEPSFDAYNAELCLRWAALVLRESRSSNASCLVLLLRYMASVTRSATLASRRNHFPGSSNSQNATERSNSLNTEMFAGFPPTR